MPLLLLLLAIAAVVVDDPARWASGYGLIRHAEWDGMLAADLVTPVFLFLLGAAIPVSRRMPRTRGMIGIAAGLCLTGLAINGLSRADVATWRIPGVLQRAGLTFAAAAAAHAAATGDHRRRIALLGSIAALITLTYWLVMAHVPAPGGSAGDLSPEGNLAGWVDRTVLGAHAWNGTWEPDGILSTLSSMSTVLLGTVAGIALTSNVHGKRNLLQLGGAGAGAIVGGVLWTAMVPINRTLWSASFVVVSAGVGTMLLAAWGAIGGFSRKGGNRTTKKRREPRSLSRRRSSR